MKYVFIVTLTKSDRLSEEEIEEVRYDIEASLEELGNSVDFNYGVVKVELQKK